MSVERRHAHCVSLGLDAALLRRVRAAAQERGIGVAAAAGAGDVPGADAVLVAVPPHAVAEVVALGARAVVACVAHGDADGAAAALDAGADDVITPRTQGAEVAARISGVVARAEARSREALVLRLAEDRSGVLVGRSPAFLRMRRIVENVATTDVPVRIEGEPGTGRGVVARTLHGLSARRDQPLFTVDAARFEAHEVHADLFGNSVGCGALWTARGATVLVRSVERLPARTQTALARWIRTRALPEGPHAGDVADTRLVVTSSASLDAAAGADHVHPDLAAALASLSVRVPPLRERPGDAALLLAHFAQSTVQPLPPLDESAAALVDRHRWPGNATEVAAVAALLALRPPAASLSAADLAPFLAAPWPGASLEGVEPVRDVVRRHVIRVLALAGGARGRAAKALGISRRTLYNHLRGAAETAPPRQR